MSTRRTLPTRADGKASRAISIDTRARNQIRIEYWKVSRLNPYERNARKNDKAVTRMRASIREYGFAVPVLAQSDGLVIDGHLRLKGAIAEGMAEVPVIPCDGWTAYNYDRKGCAGKRVVETYSIARHGE